MYNSAQNSLGHSVDPILGCDLRPPQPGFTFHHFNLLTALPHPFRLNVGSPMFPVERSARPRFISTRYDTLRHVYHVVRGFPLRSPPFAPVKQFRHPLAPEPAPSQSDPIRPSILHLFFRALCVLCILSPVVRPMPPTKDRTVRKCGPERKWRFQLQSPARDWP